MSWQRGSRKKGHFHNRVCFHGAEVRPRKLPDGDSPHPNVPKSRGLQMAAANRRFSALQRKLRIGPSVA